MAEERSLVRDVREGLEEAGEKISDAIQKAWPFGGDQNSEQGEAWSSFPIDICDDENSFVLEAELPGLTKADINIRVTENELIISGSARRKLDQEEHVLRNEIPPAHYRRTFTLSDAVDRDGLNAELNEGVLRLTLPKSERVKPRMIEITD